MKYLYLLPVFFCSIGCASKNSDKETGTPVSGPFTMHCDESVYPLMQVLCDGYMSVYPQVVITIDTTSKKNVWSLFDAKNIYSLVTVTLPSTEDSVALSQRQIYPQTFHFASDAIAFVSGKSDSAGSWFTLKDDSTCLEKSFHPVITRFISDRPDSDNSTWLQSHFRLQNGCTAEIYAAGKQQQILERVTTHPGETGIIGWSHLSEKANSTVKNWKSKINIIPYRANDTLLIYPTQSALAIGSYPLARKLYLATAEPYAGPATGFASFVASDEGQRIIRLFGLAPAKMAPREIVVN